jgi:hypothetical protein
MRRSIVVRAAVVVGLWAAGPSIAASEQAVDLKAIWSSLTAEEQASYSAAPGLVARAEGDTCAAATHEVSTLPFNDASTTVGGIDDLTYGTSCGGFNGSSGVGPDLAYVVRTDLTCNVTVTADPAAADLALWVVTNCADPVGGCVGGDDSGGNGTAEQVSFNATAGTDYFIVVDGFGGASDAFTLNITENGSTGCQLVSDATATATPTATATATPTSTSTPLGVTEIPTLSGTGGALLVLLLLAAAALALLRQRP